MLARSLIAAAAIALAFQSLPALAFHCPKDMATIDAKMSENPALSAEQTAEVKKLRADGEELHKAGKHQEAVDTLAKAMAILGIQ